MRLLLVAPLLLLAGASVASAVVIYNVDIASHLKHFTSQRFPNEEYNDGRLNAQKYIRDHFTNYGLKVFEHKFNTTVNTDPTGVTYPTKTVEGVNVIGIAEAVSNTPGAVLVVGADYDTSGLKNPMFDNGAGVAALLETARLFTHNTRWSGTSPGKPGGLFFMKDFLWSYLNQSQTNFGGAFIIDSIMNINYNANSQRLFPETYEHVVENDRKGDFLGVITIEGEKADLLRDQFAGNYNWDRKRSSYHLEEMDIKKGSKLTELVKELTKQETINYWAFTVNDTVLSLPAVLLTDTQGLRDIPPMPDSCGNMCGADDLLTTERVDFIDALVKGLVRTLMRRQGSPI
ncbi:putative Peptidase family M28-like 2, partial [Homarus americanus]